MSITGKTLFGTNGIRGLANTELTPEFAVKVGSAIGTFFKKGELIAGYDARTSGPMLAGAVIAGLNSTGCNVQLAGMAPTPALQFIIKKHKSDGGVIVTASHNPPEYNGIKVISKDGIEISREQEIHIESIYFEGKIRHADWHQLGTTKELPGVIDEYVEGIKTHVGKDSIKRKSFHVVVDGANSVGSLSAPFLLRDLGCKVTTINANLDGTFPGRPPEPRPENLKDIAQMVIAIKADLGVAYDGDADRAIFVDEKGDVHPGDKTFGLIEKYFLRKNKGAEVVTPVSSSSLVRDIAEQEKGKIIWTKVGSVTVANTMKQLGAKLGGEENGGVFYAPHIGVRDGAMTTALILDVMTRTGKKLSRLIAELPQYFIEKDKVECPENLKEKVLERLKQQVSNMNTNTIDGVKIWFKDRSAILIRPSGTEPIYRLYAEGKTKAKASALIKEYCMKLQGLIKEHR